MLVKLKINYDMITKNDVDRYLNFVASEQASGEVNVSGVLFSPFSIRCFSHKKTSYFVAGQAKFMFIHEGDRSYSSAACVSASSYNTL